MISIICAIGKNNEIGKKNELLWNLPADMKHFRETTKDRMVIMGQKTFESLWRDTNGKQVGRPLPNRRNIILTQDKSFNAEGIEPHSLDELMILLEENPKEESVQQAQDKEFFIIGGGQIYKLFIDRADKLYITHVDAEFSDADTFFPEINQDKWQKIKSEKFQKDELNKYDLEFAEYVRKV